MIYKWKIPVVSIEAQEVGEEFERLYEENGKLDPKDVVDASRDKNALLHDYFEWDDTIAAEKYRVHQAGDIIRCLVHVEETAEDAPDIITRAFVHVQQEYHPINVVVKTPSMYEELLMAAERDMEAFKRKYSELTQVKSVISAIDAYMESNT